MIGIFVSYYHLSCIHTAHRNSMVRSLETSIEINASMERVYQHLTDFKAYPEWNPKIESVNGESATEGSKVVILFKEKNHKGEQRVASMTVVHAQPPSEFRWECKNGILDYESYFKLSRKLNRTLLQTERIYSGCCLSCMWGKVLGGEETVRDDMRQAHEALKTRCENEEHGTL